jgi:Holin of 3TMs, for gene-transfer release
MGIWNAITGGGIGAIAEAGKSIATTIADAKAKRIDSEVALAQLEQQLPALQSQINLAEAGSASLFVSGWRPFIGWVCGLGIFYQFMFAPILNGILSDATRFPSIDIGDLISLLVAMLGIAGYRTIEKAKGVARE